MNADVRSARIVRCFTARLAAVSAADADTLVRAGRLLARLWAEALGAAEGTGGAGDPDGMHPAERPPLAARYRTRLRRAGAALGRVATQIVRPPGGPARTRPSASGPEPYEEPVRAARVDEASATRTPTGVAITVRGGASGSVNGLWVEQASERPDAFVVVEGGRVTGLAGGSPRAGRDVTARFDGHFGESVRLITADGQRLLTVQTAGGPTDRAGQEAPA